LGESRTTCLQDSDPLGCEVQFPRPITFQTGRIDCSDSYKIYKRENAPSNDFPGSQLTEWFKSQFGFSGRETVAIMGAHSMGNFHTRSTGYFYTYVTQQEDAFNNQYFRNMALKDEWFYEDTNCTKRGTSEGKRGQAKWMMKSEAAFENLQPVQWIQHKHVCWNCDWVKTQSFPPTLPETEKEAAIDACTNGVPNGMACRPGTETWRFIRNRDETGTTSDMGMYYDFQVDQQGFPFGCPELDNAAWTWWKTMDTGVGNNAYLKLRSNHNVDHGCGYQMHAEPVGSTPLHELVEEFADDKKAFFHAFVPAFEKMLSNGYTNLIPSPPGLVLLAKKKATFNKMLSTDV